MMRAVALSLPVMPLAMLLAACGGGSSGSGTSHATGGGGSTTAGGEVAMVRDAAIGANFSAPGPRRCSPANAEGPLTAESARAYIICSLEGEQNGYLSLVGDVQVSGVTARAYDGSTDARDGVDPSKPVYDVTGSYTSYFCNAPGGTFDIKPEEACSHVAMPNARGICYQEHSGNWQCLFLDTSAQTVGAPKSGPPGTEE